MSSKKIITATLLGLLGLVITAAAGLFLLTSGLPELFSLEDYKPHLVTSVLDRNGEKIGEYFRERRELVAYEDIPEDLIRAFVAAEDDKFYEHRGINLTAISRAFFANLRAGAKVQGGSTITQQLAKTIFLSPERTYTRKLREVILALRMERYFSKQEIMYLYLNQIYFGQGAYGVGMAAKTYFRKNVADLTLPEMAILAGLPKAPSAYSPVRNPQRAKQRQVYVLNRMREVGYISPDEEKEAIETPLAVYKRRDFAQSASYFVETVRLLLNEQLGEKAVLDEGLTVHTSLDLKAQQAAEESAQTGLRNLDKRQGYRGPLRHLEEEEEIQEFLEKSRQEYFSSSSDFIEISADGTTATLDEFKIYQEVNSKDSVVTNIPPYIEKGQIVEAVVRRVDDKWKFVEVQFAEGRGLMDLDDMAWAREPDPSVIYGEHLHIRRPSQALKVGDVILVRVNSDRFSSSRLAKELQDLRRAQGANYSRPAEVPDFTQYAGVSLEQEPLVETGLISFDLATEDVLAMVGGYDFSRSEYNRTLQSQRQTGSSFKALIYGAAFEKGYTPATMVTDSPLIYETQDEAESLEGQGDLVQWRPDNYSGNFRGDVLMREALKRSLNIPTIKILEDIGINWAISFAQRLGIFSPLNRDLSLSLGSSGVTVYEMTKAFGQIANLGRRLRPVLVHKVLNAQGEEVLGALSLDLRFKNQLEALEESFEERRLSSTQENIPQEEESTESVAEAPSEALRGSPFFFNNPDQLIRPTTAYLTTSLLQAAVREPGGTAGAIRSLGRDAAGKTGTTDGYYDGWFIGYTPQVVTGVWVGYDEEKTMGRGEVGSRSALPIWLSYMDEIHQGRPEATFRVPRHIVFANIDRETGRLASATSQEIVSQAFVEGTEPKVEESTSTQQEEVDFYKQDMAQ